MSDTHPLLPVYPTKRPIAVVVAPFRRRTIEETCRTKAAIRHLLKLGWCPIFLPYALDEFLYDEIPLQRETALACSAAFVCALAKNLDAAMFVLEGRESDGMRADIDLWVETREALIRSMPDLMPPNAAGVRYISMTDKDAP